MPFAGLTFQASQANGWIKGALTVPVFWGALGPRRRRRRVVAISEVLDNRHDVLALKPESSGLRQ
jgi:hypothetical protein